jgi:large subunit ribosomal protein L30
MSNATPKDEEGVAAAEKKPIEKTTKKKTKATKKKTTSKTQQRLRVRQVKSGNRHPWRMRRTLTALGLKHHQDEVVVPDNPSIRGMLVRVHHLVSVTPEETNG